MGDTISIHALVKRATIYKHTSNIACHHFNPRPREEGDITYLCENYMIVMYFNPRPREEGDQVSLAIKVFGKYFNPRPREEGDIYNVT